MRALCSGFIKFLHVFFGGCFVCACILWVWLCELFVVVLSLSFSSFFFVVCLFRNGFDVSVGRGGRMSARLGCFILTWVSVLWV